jgi:hypothetical protein
MGKFFQNIEPAHRKFAEKQHLFFVGTAPLSVEGHINVSPKSATGFRILSENKVAYLDLIGSGNETSAHTLENGRITFMFCSFAKTPNILRFYGKGRCILPNSEEWPLLSEHFDLVHGLRQIIVADIDLVQTSCGYGVPNYQYLGEKNIYNDWADRKTPEEMQVYVRQKNLVSIDGLLTDVAL